MLYFAKQNLVFLANPKTGTTAIEAVLSRQASVILRSPAALRHMNLPTYRRVLEPYLAQQSGAVPDIFVVLREPLDRLLSWYRYRRRPKAPAVRSTAHLSPEAFLEETLKPDPAPCARIGTQARFLGAASGQARPAFLFPYDRPEALAAFLAERFGVTDLKRANVSPEIEVGIDPDLAARVRARLVADCALHAEARDAWDSAPVGPS